MVIQSGMTLKEVNKMNKMNATQYVFKVGKSGEYAAENSQFAQIRTSENMAQAYAIYAQRADDFRQLKTTNDLSKAWTVYAANKIHAETILRRIFKISPETWVGAIEYSEFEQA